MRDLRGRLPAGAALLVPALLELWYVPKTYGCEAAARRFFPKPEGPPPEMPPEEPEPSS